MKKLLFLYVMIFSIYKCSPVSEQNGTAAQKTAPVISLTGKELLPPNEPEAEIYKKDSLLAIARKNYEADSSSLENIIWLGRRTAYLWRYQDAIDIFTKGMARFPNSPELYRHRGHRLLSIRKIDEAIADFEKAAELAKDRPTEIEPDGLPNKLNTPLSSLQFNIFYHWALALYLKGDFEKANSIYEQCMAVSDNPDLKVATADWQFMTLRRMGDTTKAAQLLATIPDSLELIENDSYYNRLLMYKGLKKPEDLLDFSKKDLEAQLALVTQGYGVGNWYFYNGEKEKAMEVFEKILATDYWSAFGYLAAEAEVARWQNL